jgi:general stress protein YciG
LCACWSYKINELVDSWNRVAVKLSISGRLLRRATVMASKGTHGGGTSKRGFASMDEEKQRQIASKGGKAAHQKGTAHEFTSEEAAEVGRKGGQASGGRRRAASQDMSEKGRKGGQH